MSEKHFRLMKKTAIFINTGRGPTVQEAALIKALEEKWIAYAGLDVLEMEPPGNNNPLLSMDNVILSAHTASASARFDPGAQAACRARAGAGAGRQVADELRQSGGAAEHQAAPLAAGLDGARPQQLSRREFRPPCQFAPARSSQHGSSEVDLAWMSHTRADPYGERGR